MVIFMQRIPGGSLLIFLLIVTTATSWASDPVPQAPVPGIVTMVDLGARSCIPCKMMAPILEELEKEYQGRAAVIFIDVWQHPEEAKKFKVSIIPTQIFFDRHGKEISRHVGFMEKQAIIDQLETLLKLKL